MPLNTGRLVAAAVAFPVALAALPVPTGLLTEYLLNPSGIDVAAPRFSWSFDALSAGVVRGSEQAAYQLQVAGAPFSASEAGILWDSGKVVSNTSYLVAYGGPPLSSDTLYYWRVCAWDEAGAGPTAYSAAATFRTGLFQRSDWHGSWITGSNGSNLLRANFSLPPGRAVAAATAYLVGVGYAELSCNGARVGTGRRLESAWTSYAHRVRYVTLDLGACLAAGGSENVLGIKLGNGWFACRGWYALPPYPFPGATNGGGFCYDTPPQALLQVNIYLDDGSVVEVVSAASGAAAVAGSSSTSAAVLPAQWLSAPVLGPIVQDSLYDGETYNASLAALWQGWDAPGFPAAASWLPPQAAVSPANNATIASQRAEPITVVEEMPALSTWGTGPASAAYDFGRYLTGVLRITLPPMAPGTVVMLRHAEILQHPPYGPADGSIYTGTLRNAHATDYYVASGDPGGEVYQPTFTQHGFRYAEVTGVVPPLPVDAVVALSSHNDVVQGSGIVVTDDVLSKVLGAVENSIKTNLQHGPQSCAGRDERQFFTGDTSLGAEASILAFGLGPMYTLWLDGAGDDQNPDGSVGFYLPTPITDGRDGSANWMTGFPTVAWDLLTHYGDERVVANAWPALLRYYGFLRYIKNATCFPSGSLANYWTEGPTEWVNLGPGANASLVNAFALLHDVAMLADMAAAVGDALTLANLTTWLAELKPNFHEAFFDPARGCYGAGSQTEQAMALWAGVPPTPAVAAVVTAYLVNDIAIAQSNHVLTGILGTRFVFEVLSRAGRSDVALAVLLNSSYPGYGYMVAGPGNLEPSTTLWEEWDTPSESDIMDSRNHLMFASVGTWLYQRLAGIVPLSRGYGTILIAPQIVNNSRVPSVSARLATPRGPVVVAWAYGSALPQRNASTCDEEEELASVVVGCADGSGGSVISNVTFASFGTPKGSCATGFTVGACAANTSLAVVEAACLGKESCTIPVSVAEFGGVDPCEGVKKSLAVQVACSQPPAPPELPPLVLNVTLPIGATALVALPLQRAAPDPTLNVTEGGVLVWARGAFVPGAVPGVLSGEWLGGGSPESPIPAVGFRVAGGGAYAFVARALAA